jgi:hypothetical protein
MAKVALGNVAELPQEQANLHQVLTIPEGDAEGRSTRHSLLATLSHKQVWPCASKQGPRVRPRPIGSADITTTPALGLET